MDGEPSAEHFILVEAEDNGALSEEEKNSLVDRKVIAYLDEHPECSKTRLTKGGLKVRKESLTACIDRLVKQGLVAVRQDGRKHLLRLTRRGKEATQMDS